MAPSTQHTVAQFGPFATIRGVMTVADPHVDPRVARTRVAVLTAAREVLVDDGWEGVTVARVAERSGYARTTLYRHWPQRLDLLRDLIRAEASVAHSTPSGDLRADLVAELEAFRSAMTGLGTWSRHHEAGTGRRAADRCSGVVCTTAAATGPTAAARA